MRSLLLLSALALLALQGWVLIDSSAAGARVAAEVEQVVALGDDEASEIALAVPIDTYPFSPQAFAARRQVAGLDGALARRNLPGSPLPLRDPWWLASRPWVGPSGVLVLAALLLLMGLLGPRSRVRALSLLGLLGLTGAAALGQGWLVFPGPPPDDGLAAMVTGQAEALAYAAFPWVTLAGLALGVVLLLLPRRRPSA